MEMNHECDSEVSMKCRLLLYSNKFKQKFPNNSGKIFCKLNTKCFLSVTLHLETQNFMRLNFFK